MGDFFKGVASFLGAIVKPAVSNNAVARPPDSEAVLIHRAVNQIEREVVQSVKTKIIKHDSFLRESTDTEIEIFLRDKIKLSDNQGIFLPAYYSIPSKNIQSLDLKYGDICLAWKMLNLIKLPCFLFILNFCQISHAEVEFYLTEWVPLLRQMDNISQIYIISSMEEVSIQSLMRVNSLDISFSNIYRDSSKLANRISNLYSSPPLSYQILHQGHGIHNIGLLKKENVGELVECEKLGAILWNVFRDLVVVDPLSALLLPSWKLMRELNGENELIPSKFINRIEEFGLIERNEVLEKDLNKYLWNAVQFPFCESPDKTFMPLIYLLSSASQTSKQKTPSTDQPRKRNSSKSAKNVKKEGSNTRNEDKGYDQDDADDHDDDSSEDNDKNLSRNPEDFSVKKKRRRNRKEKDQRKDKKKKARREDSESGEDDDDNDGAEEKSDQQALGRYFPLHPPSSISNEKRVFYTPCHSTFHMEDYPMLENVLYQTSEELPSTILDKFFVCLIAPVRQSLLNSFTQEQRFDSVLRTRSCRLTKEVFLKLIFHLQEFKIERRFKNIIEPAETAYFYKFEGQEFSISIDGNLVKVNYEGESPLAIYSLMEFLFQQIKMKSIRFEFMSYLLEEDTYYQISSIQDFMINPNKSQCDSLNSKSFLLIREAHFPWIPSSLHEEYLFLNYDIYLFSFSSDIDSITTRFSEQLFQRLAIHSTEGSLFRKTRVYLDNARTRRNDYTRSNERSYYALARSKIFVPIFTFAELEQILFQSYTSGPLLSSCFLAYFLIQAGLFSVELNRSNNPSIAPIAAHLQTIYPILLNNEKEIIYENPEDIRLFFKKTIFYPSSSQSSFLRSIEEIFPRRNICSPKPSDIRFLWKVFVERFIALVSADPTKEFHWTPSSEKVVITKELLNLLYLNQTTPSISTLTEAYRSPLLDCYLQDLRANHPSQLFYCYQRIASHCRLPFSSSIDIPVPCLYYSISHYRGSLLHQKKMIENCNQHYKEDPILQNRLITFDVDALINDVPATFSRSVLSELGSIQRLVAQIKEQRQNLYCWKIEDSLQMIKEYVQRAQKDEQGGRGEGNILETSNEEIRLQVGTSNLPSSESSHSTQEQQNMKHYDVFISYAWRDENNPDNAEENILNHFKVKFIVNILIEKYKLKVFFDEYDLAGHMPSSISKAISQSALFIPVITSVYNEKIASEKQNDFCFYEFQFAHTYGGNFIMPLILESAFSRPSSWCTYLQAVCGSYLFIDISQEISRLPISMDEDENRNLMDIFCRDRNNFEKFDVLVTRIRNIVGSDRLPSIPDPSSSTSSASSLSSTPVERSLVTRVMSLLGASLASFPIFRDNSHSSQLFSNFGLWAFSRR